MIGKRPRPSSLPSTTQRWIVTYTDLCTLLLTFFVLLVSMSTVDSNRQKKALGALDGSFGESAPKTRSPSGMAQEDRGGSQGVAPGEKDYPALKSLSVENNLNADQVLVGKNKTMIRIDQKVLFRPGTTEISGDVQKYLAELSAYFSRTEDGIEIRGHTDIHEGMDHPNWSMRSWELSVRRAQAVYAFFLQKGIRAERMSAHGFSYLHPLVDSRGFPGLSEKNQRVEILLGSNHAVPSGLVPQNRQSNPFYNYKDFFFRLYSPHEEKDEDLQPWVKRFYEAAEAQDNH
ncbi:MAG: flagellar motor protein MotB [Syntrophobacteraceae bacterium]|nr:OmpA family protein [Desulfobacteraceae bacterium]